MQIKLDSIRHAAIRGNEVIDLRQKEFQVLAYFLTKPGQICTKQELFVAIWRRVDGSFSNVVDVCICSLRDRIGEQHILTARGKGYVFLHL